MQDNGDASNTNILTQVGVLALIEEQQTKAKMLTVHYNSIDSRMPTLAMNSSADVLTLWFKEISERSAHSVNIRRVLAKREFQRMYRFAKIQHIRSKQEGAW